MFAAQPVSRFTGIAQLVGVPGATFAAYLVSTAKLGGWMGASVGLAIVTVLLIVAGGRLELEKGRRLALRVELGAEISLTEHIPPPVKGQTYKDNVSFWISVTNCGPRATFRARLVRADFAHQDVPRGIDETTPLEGGIDLLAWEENDKVQVEIQRDFSQSIHLANLSREPRAFAFYTAQKGSGRKFLGSKPTALELHASLAVNFTIEVANVDADRSYRANGRIAIHPGETLPTITVKAL